MVQTIFIIVGYHLAVNGINWKPIKSYDYENKDVIRCSGCYCLIRSL